MIYVLLFLLVLLGLIVLALILPVGVDIDFRASKLGLKVIIFGIPITIPTENEETEEEEKNLSKRKTSNKKSYKSEKKKKESTTADTKVKKKTSISDIVGILELVMEILPEVGRFLGRLGRGIIITKLEIFLILYDEDFDKLGRKVGYTNAVLSGIQPMLASSFTLRDYKALASGSFGIEYKDTIVEARIYVVPVVILGAAVKLGLSAIFKYIKYGKKTNAK